MAKVTEEQVRTAFLKELKSNPKSSTTDLFYEVDYKLRVGHTFTQRVMYAMMSGGALRLVPDLELIIT